MRWLTVFLSFILVSAAFAQELTLEKAVEIALKRNPSYKISLLSVRSAKEMERVAFSKKLFTVDFSYSYTRLNEEQQVNVEPVEIPPLFPGASPMVIKPHDIVISRQNVYEYKFTFFQPIFTGGKISMAHEIAKLGVDVEMLKEKEARLDLVFEVKRAYLNALKAKKFLSVAKETVKLLKAHYRDALEFYKQGITPKVDLLRTEVALSRAKQRLTDAEAAYKLALSALAVLLRDKVDASYELHDVEVKPSLELSFDDCLRIAFSNRPVIKAVAKQVEVARRYVKLEQSDYYPQIGLAGEYSKHGNNPDCDGDGLTDAERWAISLQLKWNLFAWGKTRHSVERARIEELKALEQLKAVKDKVALEVREAYLKLISARDKLMVAEKEVAQAKENYRDTRERYKEQIDTSTDVIDAQVFLSNAETRYYEALYDYNIAYARLVRVMGRE